MLDKDVLQEVHADVKEVKQQMVELIKQSAVHNEILSTHERRSTNLEERFKPIEQTWIFISKLSAVILTSAALIAALGVIKNFVINK